MDLCKLAKSLIFLTILSITSCQAPMTRYPQNLLEDNPSKDILKLEISFNEAEKDFLEIISLVGYAGADIQVEASLDLDTAELGGSSIRENERFIEYNLLKLNEVNQTHPNPEKRWGSKWVLAHELGHHLHGHLSADRFTTRAEELQCDRFSGYILGMLGATLEDASFVLEKYTKPVSDDSDYPSKKERLASLAKGWEDAQLIIRKALDTNSKL